MSADRPRPYGNPAADRAREDLLKHILGDEPEHNYDCKCDDCIAWREQAKAGRK